MPHNAPPSPRVVGAVNRVWRGRLTVGGEALLDGDRLSFRPTGPLASFLEKHAFALPLADLVQLGWQDRGRRLDLVTVGETLSLEGTTAPRLAAALAARGVPFVDAAELSDGRVAPAPLLRIKDATWVMTPVHHSGVLALGGAGLRFEPTGLMEQLAGFDGFAVALASLCHAQADGGRLTLTTPESTHILQVSDGAAWVQAIAVAAAGVPLPGDATLPEPTNGPEDPAAMAFDAALERVAQTAVVRGRAALNGSGALSFSGLDGEVRGASVGAVQQAVYGRASSDHPGVLSLVGAAGERWRLHPHGGAGDLARLRDLALSLPISGAVDLGSLGALRRLSGATSFVRVTTDHRDALTMRPGAIVQAPDAIGVVLEDDGGFRPPAGTRVRAVIAHDRGLLEVDGRVRRIVEDGAEWGWAGAAVLFVAVPHADDVRVMRTRRETYRVPTTEPIRLRALRRVAGRAPMPWGPDQRARMVDLSAGGCGVVSDRQRAVGALMQADVVIRGRPEPLTAQVVFEARVREDDEDRWRHGLRFEGLTEADHERLTRDVVRRETRAMRQAQDEAETELLVEPVKPRR